ncbi:thiamine biosynthesis protein ApbE [Hoylesella timonensis S9-PR14]|uniref:FAD:protein FMN transferase n=2 Tax=Hoylesella timonensis TaxID=386414 RepID=A0A098YRW0_9BACT|nr:FAD:protein FMN transferase [Hoylesella timonensis]KGI21398.1 thiamine biosynthesis protein ApbE [Hoylesella timonensis S9-PR14]
MKITKSSIFRIVFLLFLIVGSIYIIRQQNTMPYQHNTGQIFGTTYHITYQSNKDLHREILQRLQLVDQTFSTFNDESIISKINRNEPVKLNQMFIEVFDLAKTVSKDTHGAFDITVAPLVNVWGFGFKSGTPPTKAVIDSLRHLTGYEKVKLIGSKVRKQDPRIMLDCSAIAKGYGSDVVAQYLRSRDVENFMIEIGGEIVVQGNSDKRLPWKIGVTKPTDDSTQVNNELQTVLNVTNTAMATSGNYRRFYYKNGKKYAHTIDPKTGYPVQHNILSATVLANTCAKADAYATSFMVLGLEKTQQVLQHHPDLMVYLIYADGQGKNKVWYSPSLKKAIQGAENLSDKK